MAPLDQISDAIPALRRYAVAQVRDREAADDLVQDCLLRALERRHLWRGEGSPRAWMFRILLNLVRDDHRHRRTRAHLTVVTDARDAFPDAPVAGGQDSHMDLVEVHAAMGRLPEDQRAALLLVAVEGMRLAEAAEALDIPEGTLVSRLGRARAALRQLTDTPRSAAEILPLGTRKDGHP